MYVTAARSTLHFWPQLILVGTGTAWMTSTEIAERTGLSARYIREEIREGTLTAVKFGTRGGHGTYRVPLNAAEGYIKRMLGLYYEVPDQRQAS